jgi:urease accessory protein UreF
VPPVPLYLYRLFPCHPPLAVSLSLGRHLMCSAVAPGPRTLGAKAAFVAAEARSRFAVCFGVGSTTCGCEVEVVITMYIYIKIL